MALAALALGGVLLAVKSLQGKRISCGCFGSLPASKALTGFFASCAILSLGYYLPSPGKTIKIGKEEIAEENKEIPEDKEETLEGKEEIAEGKEKVAGDKKEIVPKEQKPMMPEVTSELSEWAVEGLKDLRNTLEKKTSYFVRGPFIEAIQLYLEDCRSEYFSAFNLLTLYLSKNRREELKKHV